MFSQTNTEFQPYVISNSPIMKKPFGKEPFAWKHDPQYQQEKLQKLEKLHEKILEEQLGKPKDKYGNLLPKHMDLTKQPSEDLVESKKKRFTSLMKKDIEESGQQIHPYHIVGTFQRCGNSIIENNPNRRSIGSGESDRKEIDNHRESGDNFRQLTDIPQRKSIRKEVPIASTAPRPPMKKPEAKIPKKPQNKDGKKVSEFLYQRYGGEMGPDSHLIEMLQRQVITHDLNIKMEDVADLDTAKNLLQEAVLLPLMIPNFFQGIRRPWKGVLMFGPPGTGKTLLAKAVASTGKTKFFNISASSLASKWRGQSQKLVRLLFEMARFYAPSTVFIDEVDSVASRRSDHDDQSSRKVKTELLTQMDGVGSGSQKPVIVIAATNRPWDLDEALRRRLQKRIYVPLPNQKGRKELFVTNTKNIKLDKSINFDTLAKKTKGYSGADIVILIRSASFLPLRRYFQKKGGMVAVEVEQCKKEVDIPLTQDDFLEALKGTNPSVGNADLAKYEKWMEQFGSV